MTMFVASTVTGPYNNHFWQLLLGGTAKEEVRWSGPKARHGDEVGVDGLVAQAQDLQPGDNVCPMWVKSESFWLTNVFEYCQNSKVASKTKGAAHHQCNQHSMEVIYRGYNEDYDFGDNNTRQTESEIRVYFINLLLQQLDYISQLILQGTCRQNGMTTLGWWVSMLTSVQHST